MDGFEGSEGSEAIHDDSETYESDDRDKTICPHDESNAEAEDVNCNDDDESKSKKEGNSNWRSYCCCNDATTHSPSTDITHSSTTQAEDEASGSHTNRGDEEDTSNAEAQDHNTDHSSAEEDGLNEENSHLVYDYTIQEDVTEPWWLAIPKPIYTIRRVRNQPITNNEEDETPPVATEEEEDGNKAVDHSNAEEDDTIKEEEEDNYDVVYEPHAPECWWEPPYRIHRVKRQAHQPPTNNEEDGNNSNTREEDESKGARRKTRLIDRLCPCFPIKPRDAQQLSDAEQDPPNDDESSS